MEGIQKKEVTRTMQFKRIESLLEKDLRDPNEIHQLLMIIKSLVALGKLIWSEVCFFVM